MLRKVLIANRGEIACRVIRSCRELGLATVAVYSQADAGALHVEMADEAHAIGPAPAKQSYLSVENVLAAAKASGADAVHPGYGFLAENPDFATAVIETGLAWVGPRPKTTADMGDKERARMIAKGAGLPVLTGSTRFPPGGLAGLDAAGETVGYPLLVKASAGGGGIGMRRVDSAAGLAEVVEVTQSLAAKAFGDGTIYLERLVPKARHVEIQVFGFGDGRAVHLYERDCSVQRRFQKMIEETPSPGLGPETRAAMAGAALALASQERYLGAGTVEFIVGPDQNFYFMEMNTRIQVEHPVTEMTTGLDLVELQIRLARGDDLSWLTQHSISSTGHAIECRIYAENPDKNFLPAPGPLDRFEPPEERDGLRVDTGVRQGDQISFHYDPMLAKVIALGENRDRAIDNMLEALDDFRVAGVATNIPFLRRAVAHAAFRAGDTFTDFVDTHSSDLIPP